MPFASTDRKNTDQFDAGALQDPDALLPNGGRKQGRHLFPAAAGWVEDSAELTRAAGTSGGHLPA